jgi:hypothetical protein
MSIKSNKYPEKGFDMSSYKVIPEHIMEASAETAIEMGESDNSFSRMLLAASEYKKAEMTPMFILDVRNMDVYCVAKETFGKKLH